MTPRAYRKGQVRTHRGFQDCSPLTLRALASYSCPGGLTWVHSLSPRSREFKSFTNKLIKKRVIKHWKGNHEFLNKRVKRDKKHIKLIGVRGNNDISKHLLKSINCKFQSELSVPVYYKGLKIESELRCDLFIEGILPVELKAVDEIHPIHEAQLLTYMRLLNVPEGVLYNFNVVNLYQYGQRTYVNELYRELDE